MTQPTPAHAALVDALAPQLSDALARRIDGGLDPSDALVWMEIDGGQARWRCMHREAARWALALGNLPGAAERVRWMAVPAPPGQFWLFVIESPSLPGALYAVKLRPGAARALT